MRKPISASKNIFFDSKNVDDTDLTQEQIYNDTVVGGLIENTLGTGVLPEVLEQQVLFSSLLENGFTDGKAINAQKQPSDSNFGNILEVELSESKAAGKKTVKVFIVGLDFNNALQYERFTFNKNEKQLSAKHFKIILLLMTNDIIGNVLQSQNLGGILTIKEANPITLSRSPMMISQDVEPNVFFRDFFVSSGGTLQNALATALSSYNIDALNINLGYTRLLPLLENDVSSQVGQKFLASTNSIQKISLLMSVVNNVTPADLNWTGDLIVSIYQVQSALTCPTDIVPQLAIDFDPSNIPLAQLSLNYGTLQNSGVVLNEVPQPVDFVFSNTPVGSGLVIKPGSYYVIAIKRAGSADTCQIQFAAGGNTSDVMRETLFNGSIWVDVPEESLWFQTYTDAAKVSDGQAYDNGYGIQIPKTIIDTATALTIDYSYNNISFIRNDLYYAQLSAITEKTTLVQDERTGDNVFSRQNYAPKVNLLNTAALANIKATSNPLLIGTISDKNIKSFNAANTTITASFHEYGIVKNEVVIKVITDPTDGYRYDQNIIQLVSELVSGNLNSAKFIPNNNNSSVFYRISKAELLTMKYGDVNGDGIIDEEDLLLANKILNSNLNSMPTYQEYITNTTVFANDSGITWNVVNPDTMVSVASGVDGYLTVNPLDGSIANFQSAAANFNSITNLDGYKLSVSTSNSIGNIGLFKISSLINNHNITIEKVIYSSDTILQIMRGDVNSDMILNSTDIGYITDYINSTAVYPANNVGTPFTAIRLTLEAFVDRNDDYPSVDANRAAIVHPTQDIYLDGYSLFAGVNLKTSPMSFSSVKQLVWDSSNIVVSSRSKQIAATFFYDVGDAKTSCRTPGVLSETYPFTTDFDPGKNDFFIPNNLVVNGNGQILRPDGNLMKQDFEIATVLIEIPNVSFDQEYSINLMTNFVFDFTGDGITRAGYPCMKFADCSKVESSALVNNQIRFAVSVQSFSPQTNGIDEDCIDGIIIDGKIGVNVDYGTGMLTLNFANLYQDPVLKTLNTKIEITAYLKKAGWNNVPVFVSSNKSQNILGVPTPSFPNVECPDPPVVI